MTGPGAASSTTIGIVVVPVAPPASVTRRRTVGAGAVVGERRLGRREVESSYCAVVVEVPGVGQRAALRVGRAAAVERDRERRGPLVGSPG